MTTKKQNVKVYKTIKKVSVVLPCIFSFGCDWFGTKKKIKTISCRTISSSQIEGEKLINDTKTDEDIPGQVNDAFEPPNSCAVPAQLPNLTQVTLKSSQKSKQPPVPVEDVGNAGSRPSNRLNELSQSLNSKNDNITPVNPNNKKKKNDDNKVTDLTLPVESLDDATKENTSPNQNLPIPLQHLKTKINHLMNLKNELNELCKHKPYKKLAKKINKENLFNKIDAFCNQNSSIDVLNHILRLPEKARQEYIESSANLANGYIKKLEELLSQSGKNKRMRGSVH